MNDGNELQQLQQITLGQAWWSYDAAEHAFTVSPAWEQLTGYKAAEQFPQQLNPNIPIEQLLDNFIERWLLIVSEKDRPKARRTAEDFLLTSSTSGTFVLDYELICADGTKKLVISHGASIWENHKLKRLFVTLQDIDQLRDRTTSAAAIADTQHQLDKTKNALAALKSNLSTIGTIGALVVAGLGTFNDALENIVKELRRTWATITDPASISDIPASLISSEIEESQLQEFERAIIRNAPIGISSARVVAYSPGRFPGLYQTIVEVNYDFPSGDSWPVLSVESSIESAQKTNAHVGGQPYEARHTGLYRYSVPFSVNLGKDRIQYFYVEFDTETLKQDLIEDIQATAIRLAADMENLLSPS